MTLLYRVCKEPGIFVNPGKTVQTGEKRRSQNGVLSLDMSYLPFSMKVSESRTGQDVCLLKLAPRLVSKG
jgi:hypothetical protein